VKHFAANVKLSPCFDDEEEGGDDAQDLKKCGAESCKDCV